MRFNTIIDPLHLHFIFLLIHKVIVQQFLFSRLNPTWMNFLMVFSYLFPLCWHDTAGGILYTTTAESFCRAGKPTVSGGEPEASHQTQWASQHGRSSKLLLCKEWLQLYRWSTEEKDKDIALFNYSNFYCNGNIFKVYQNSYNIIFKHYFNDFWWIRFFYFALKFIYRYPARYKTNFLAFLMNFWLFSYDQTITLTNKM